MSHGKLVAVKVYDYDKTLNTFTPYHSVISVQLQPFAHGGMRQAHYGYRHSDFQNIVIKRDLQGDNNSDDTKNDVRMQWRCKDLASEYNKYAVATKKINFVDAFMVEFNGGPWDGEFAFMEPYLEGKYIKHSGNIPAGRPMTPRITPQAFSHFTYWFTNGRELVCDIQGVNDDYTDPQIHTNPQTSRYGKGNCGPFGIQLFLQTHLCSEMCHALGLPPTSNGGSLQQGTVPNYFALKLEQLKRGNYQ